MRRLWRAAAGAGAALALVLVAGCGGSDPDGAAPPVGAEAPAGSGDDGEGSDTGGDQGAGGGLPDDWPAEFPDPPAGAAFDELSGPVTQDDRIIYIVDYLVEDGDLQEIFAYYLEALPAAGWDGNFDADPSAAVVIATVLFRGSGASGEVLLDDNLGPVLVRIFMYLDR
jgi:hypothetical protein